MGLTAFLGLGARVIDLAREVFEQRGCIHTEAAGGNRGDKQTQRGGASPLHGVGMAQRAGERYEHSEMYPGFAAIAREEGFPEIAAIFLSIAVAEKQHEKRYLDLLANIENNRVFHRDEPVVWRCRNCGYLHTGTDAIDCCPACNHPKAHFEILAENW